MVPSIVLLASFLPIALAGPSRIARRQLPTGSGRLCLNVSQTDSDHVCLATEFDTKTNECNIPDATSILTSSLNFGAGAKNGA
jgi:hypothetical protein